jgi:hypothetical protein
MKDVYKVISGIGLLIFLYLIVTNAYGFARIIEAISSNAVSGIEALQGR